MNEDSIRLNVTLKKYYGSSQGSKYGKYGEYEVQMFQLSVMLHSVRTVQYVMLRCVYAAICYIRYGAVSISV